MHIIGELNFSNSSFFCQYRQMQRISHSFPFQVLDIMFKMPSIRGSQNILRDTLLQQQIILPENDAGPKIQDLLTRRERETNFQGATLEIQIPIPK